MTDCVGKTTTAGVTVGQRAGGHSGARGRGLCWRLGRPIIPCTRHVGLPGPGLRRKKKYARAHAHARARLRAGGVRALRAIASKLGGTKGRTRKRFLLWPLLPIRTHFSNSAFADSTFNLASANPTTRTQDAGLQEPRFGAEVSFCPCSHLQHVQRSTPSHFSKDTLNFSSLGHGCTARDRCCSMIVSEILRVYRLTT